MRPQSAIGIPLSQFPRVATISGYNPSHNPIVFDVPAQELQAQVVALVFLGEQLWQTKKLLWAARQLSKE